jgi:hypothetical protein
MKGCKAGKKCLEKIDPRVGHGAGWRAVGFATQPLGIVSFLLTPQEQRRRIPATFP